MDVSGISAYRQTPEEPFGWGGGGGGEFPEESAGEVR